MLLDTDPGLNFSEVFPVVLAPHATQAASQQIEANVQCFLHDFRKKDSAFLKGLSVSDVYDRGNANGPMCLPPQLVERVEAAPSTLFIIAHEAANAKDSESVAKTMVNKRNVVILSISQKRSKADKTFWHKVGNGE